MGFVDSHCHLDDRQYEQDRDAVIERALEAGLTYMLAIGTGEGPPELEAAVRLAERHDPIFATVGVHPNDAAKVTQITLSQVADVLKHPKVVALGEIGLCRDPIRDPGIPDLCLGSHEALCHRRLTDQEGAGDLRSLKPAE